jgi:hypothetical protein
MRSLFLLLLTAIIVSCSKDENTSFLWEKTGGEGVISFSMTTIDSMLLFSGSLTGSPYAFVTRKSGTKEFSYSPDISGVFTSCVEDSSGFFLAGSSEGELLLTRLNKEGEEVWTYSVNADAEIESATVLRLADNSYIAVASDHVDSVRYSTFLIVYFDREGNIESTYEPSPGYKVAINDAALGSGGELYFALTKILAGAKTKASIGRFTSEGAKIWERELYNNPDFEAATLEIDVDETGNIYATGNTELSFEDELLMNSWVVALDPSGSVLWKNYLENSNSGEEISFDMYSSLLVMNMNCGIVNYISIPDGKVGNRLRVYDVCDPYDTAVKIYSMAVTPAGNYIMAGSKSGKVYYALRRGLIYDN